MPDPTTTNIVLAVPTHNSDSGIWDAPVNGNTNILDACLGSVTSKSLLTVNVTLSTTESQVAILRFTGNLINNITITLGAIIKSWVCENLCTGAFTVTVKGSPGTGNVVGLPPGSCQIYWDGTNVSFLNLGKIGEYWDYAGTAVPAWVTACTVPPYLNCNGGTFSAVTYPLLNAILGGTTLPDSKGRLRATLDQSAGRITSGGSGVNGAAVAAAGGAQNVAIAQTGLPNVTLSASPSTTIQALTQAGNFNAANVALGSTPVLQSIINVTTITLPSYTTGSLNGGVGQTQTITMPPVYIGGVTMIRAA